MQLKKTNSFLSIASYIQLRVVKPYQYEMFFLSICLFLSITTVITSVLIAHVITKTSTFSATYKLCTYSHLVQRPPRVTKN